MSIAALTPTPKMQFSDTNGIPLAGGFVFTYSAGTSSQLATFTDSTEAAQNTNPIVLDAGGFANIWLGSNAYRFVVQDANGVQQYTTDNITANNITALSSSAFLEAPLTVGIVGQDVLAGNSVNHRLSMSNDGAPFDAIVGQNTTDTLTNKTLTSPTLHTPSIDTPTNTGDAVNLGTTELRGGVLLGATGALSQIVLVGNSDIYGGLIQSAIAALPAAGGVIDARSAGVAALPQGTINPGTKAVTILLGPYSYSVTQILLGTSTRIYGAGSGGFSQQTVIQSTAATTDIFVISGTNPISSVHLKGFRVYGAFGIGGSTNQSALSLIAAINGGGVFYSVFEDLYIAGCAGALGTHGVIRLDGSAGGSPPGIIQFNSFRNITVFRSTGGGPALELNGLVGQQTFMDCEFDGQPADATGTNILIQDSATGLFPLSCNFYNVTTQAGDVGVNTKGCNMCGFYQMHFEKEHGAFLIGPSVSGTTLTTVQIQGSQFNGDVGINAGNGYLINVTELAAKAAVVFGPMNNYSAMDTVFKGNIGAITPFANVGPPVNGTFLWNTNSGWSYTNINTGINPDGTGLKHGRITTGSVGAGVRVSVTLTWTTSFGDANYTVSGSVLDATTGGTASGLVLERFNNIAANLVRATVFNPTGGALTGTLNVIAVHD